MDHGYCLYLLPGICLLIHALSIQVYTTDPNTKTCIKDLGPFVMPFTVSPPSQLRKGDIALPFVRPSARLE